MLATDERSPPGGPASFKGVQAGGGMQVNDGGHDVAAPAAISEPATKLLAKYKLLAKATLDRRLSKADLIVLVVIMERINSVTGKAFPSTSRVAVDAAVDDRTVSRAIKSLCERGYLIRRSGDRTNANEYRLGTGGSVGTGEVAPTGESAGTGESVAMYGRACPKGTGESAHPIHVINPFKESAEEKHLHEPAGSRRRNDDQDEVVVIPLKGGGEHVITSAEVREWEQVYRDRDVLMELRKARQWCIANPGKQKTRNGVRRFLNGWLARTANANANAPPERMTAQAAHTGFDQIDYQKDADEWNATN